MKLSIFLLSSIFTFGKGREWLNYSFSFFLFLVVLPHDFSKGERDLRISPSAKKKEVKENEKVCAQDEGKTPKFQSSLILLHLVWESCTNKKRMKGRGIKAQLCLSEYFQNVLNEKPPVFHAGSPKGEGNGSSCHLLGIHSPVSLRAFETLGQAWCEVIQQQQCIRLLKTSFWGTHESSRNTNEFLTTAAEEKFANSLLGVTPLPHHRAEENW